MAMPVYVAEITGPLAEQLAVQRNLHATEGIFVLLNAASFLFDDGARSSLVTFKQHDVVDGSFFDFLLADREVQVVACDEVGMADLVCNYVDKWDSATVSHGVVGTCDLLSAGFSRQEVC